MKKKITFLIGGIVLLAAFTIGFLYLDYKRDIHINRDYVYSEEDVFLIQKDRGGRSLYTRIFHGSLPSGYALVSVGEDGKTEEVMHIEDGIIYSTYRDSSKLVVFYTKTTDMNKTQKSYKLTLDLSALQEYEVEECAETPPVAYDPGRQTYIRRQDLVLKDALYSNVLISGDGLIYADGNELVLSDSSGEHVLAQFGNGGRFYRLFEADARLWIVAYEDYRTKIYGYSYQDAQLSEIAQYMEPAGDACIGGQGIYIESSRGILCVTLDGNSQLLFEPTQETGNIVALYDDGQLIVLCENKKLIFDSNGVLLQELEISPRIYMNDTLVETFANE